MAVVFRDTCPMTSAISLKLAPLVSIRVADACRKRCAAAGVLTIPARVKARRAILQTSAEFRNGGIGGKTRRNTLRDEHRRRPHCKYSHNAAPTSCGSGKRRSLHDLVFRIK